jgi:hypothetical protein
MMDQYDDAVSGVDDLLGIHVVRFETLVPGFDEVGKAGRPGIRGGSIGQLDAGQVPDDVRVDQIDILCKAALVVDL